MSSPTIVNGCDSCDAASTIPASSGTAAASSDLCSAGCGQVAKQSCPTCIELKLKPTRFCSQECFKQSWKEHNTKVHKRQLTSITSVFNGFDKSAQMRKPKLESHHRSIATRHRHHAMCKMDFIVRYALKRSFGLSFSPQFSLFLFVTAVKDRLAFVPPAFDYTGPLRPAYVSPKRTVPAHIQRPDYATNGMPQGENRNTIHINSDKEIKGIRAACRLGREALDHAARHVRPGITTDEIDELVHNFIIEHDGYPSPLNYKFFPKSVCTSVNEVICHGIPDARPLEDGDIVNVDVTVFKDGYHGDLNETFVVGTVDQKSKDLIKTTHDALMKALELVKPGALFRDFGEVITKMTGKAGFSVVRSYCGHGIGALFHSPPSIPHYARNKAVGQCKPGMVFTIEPMINMGTWKDVTWSFDDWTSTTADGKRSAQFEHTILVTEKGCEILTARLPTSPPLWWEVESASSSSISATAAVPTEAK